LDATGPAGSARVAALEPGDDFDVDAEGRAVDGDLIFEPGVDERLGHARVLGRDPGKQRVRTNRQKLILCPLKHPVNVYVNVSDVLPVLDD
jgi:hypothetical protein